MRTDETLGSETQSDQQWDAVRFGGRDDPIDQSFSGKERNKWYYNIDPGADAKRDRSFTDLSTLSGVDSIADGRVFATLDFNRDGQLDIALCNANAPILNLFQNQIQSDQRFIAIRFVGGMTAKKTDRRLSSRDGYGAKLKLKLNDQMTLTREFRCGEGFAGQSSDTMIVGLGVAASVQEIEVKWPSGIADKISKVESGSLLTLFENGKAGEPDHKIEPYRK